MNNDINLECDHIFKRCGLASVVDFQSKQWAALFRLMVVEENRFLSHENDFRGPDYIWPKEALKNWSRVWEYPYVYSHLQAWMASGRNDRALTFVDYGSGVTFFPFALAKLNYNIICVDIDPVCVKGVRAATNFVPPGPGKITACLLDGSRIPLKKNSVDGAYCISVLEHISKFEETVDELHRVIKPGGLLVITIDLGLGPLDEISAMRFRDLIKILGAKFKVVYPHTTIHPDELLTPRSSIFPMRSLGLVQLGIYLLKQMVKAIIGRRPRWQPYPNLVVMGMVLQKT